MKTRGAARRSSSFRRSLSRRDFLKLGGAGLAGAALLGTAGCDGGEQQSGGVQNLVMSSGPDNSGSLQEVIARFNDEYQGEIIVSISGDHVSKPPLYPLRDFL